MWRKLLAIMFVFALALLSFMVVEPGTAQTNVTWRGEYFNNSILSGPSAFVRQDSAIAFNWGGGSPGSGISPNGFSVRWSTDIFLPAGTYRFYALADDNVSVTVDFRTTVISTFDEPRIGEVVTGDITLDASTHHIQVDYREIIDAAYVFVSFANLADNPSGPDFSFPLNLPRTEEVWMAAYFANSNLGGSPAVIRSEQSAGGNWSAASPAAPIPQDNWSARWSTIKNLEGGDYRISARSDDGVRVFLDGVLVIDEWHSASGQTYTVTRSVPPGQHHIVVEFFEQGGLAFLEWDFARIGGTPVTGGATATVVASLLNVRDRPDPINGQILVRINGGESYPVLGQNGDGTWVRINVNNTIGWVNQNWVTLSNAQNLPIVQNPGVPSDATATVTAGRLNVRDRPDPINGQILTKIDFEQAYPVLGQNPAGTWFQINVNGTIGWVSGNWVRLNNAGSLPIIVMQPGSVVPTLAPTPQPTSTPDSITTYTATATPYTVNIRSGPGTQYTDIGNLPVNQTATVIGRNASSTWWQINYQGIVGWVSAVYARLEAGADISRIPVTG